MKRKDLGKLERERNRYRKALQKICRLDPAGTEEGYNEWGEAACFNWAQDIAEEALACLPEPEPEPASPPVE